STRLTSKAHLLATPTRCWRPCTLRSTDQGGRHVETTQLCERHVNAGIGGGTGRDRLCGCRPCSGQRRNTAAEGQRCDVEEGQELFLDLQGLPGWSARADARLRACERGWHC